MNPTEHDRELLRHRFNHTQEVLGSRRLRSDLTEEQKAEALRIGRIGDQFKSAGATRKPSTRAQG